MPINKENSLINYAVSGPQTGEQQLKTVRWNFTFQHRHVRPVVTWKMKLQNIL